MVAGFTLRVFFYGLVAFVPNKPDSTIVLVVDGRAPITPDTCLNHPHDPLVGFAGGRADCVSGDCDYAKNVVEGEHCRATGWWRLSGQVVYIPTISLPGAPKVQGSKGRSGLPSSGEDEDFGWAAQMASIDPIAGDVDRSVLGGPSALGKVAGRIDIQDGLLRSCQLVTVPRGSGGKQLGVPLIAFGSRVGKVSPQVQALAEIFVLEKNIDGDFVTIAFTNFSDEKEIRRMNIYPGSCPGGGTNDQCLDIFIVNEPIFNHEEPKFCETYDPNNPKDPELFRAVHFPLYYNLSKIGGLPWQLRMTPFWKDTRRITGNTFEDRCGSPVLEGCLPMFEGFEPGAGPLNRPICPPVTFNAIE